MPLLNSYQLIAIIIGSLFFCHQALAGSPKNQAEAFLLSMQSGDIEKAFADLLIESPLVSQSPEKVSNLKAQTKTALTLYGKIKGYDFVSEATLGFSVVKLTYVQKMDSVALVWNFFFYLPKDKWYLSNIELSAWSLAETVQYQNEYRGIKPGLSMLEDAVRILGDYSAAIPTPNGHNYRFPTAIVNISGSVHVNSVTIDQDASYSCPHGIKLGDSESSVEERLPNALVRDGIFIDMDTGITYEVAGGKVERIILAYELRNWGPKRLRIPHLPASGARADDLGPFANEKE
jgi:hypothetical protein